MLIDKVLRNCKGPASLDAQYVAAGIAAASPARIAAPLRESPNRQHGAIRRIRPLLFARPTGALSSPGFPL